MLTKTKLLALLAESNRKLVDLLWSDETKADAPEPPEPEPAPRPKFTPGSQEWFKTLPPPRTGAPVPLPSLPTISAAETMPSLMSRVIFAIGIRQPFDRGDRVHGYVIYRNRGHLPARKLSWYTRTDTVQQGAEEFPIGEMSEPRGVIAPGTEMIVPAGTFFTDKLRNALFVWGMVTYDDGFGNRRYTKFCHQYYTKPILGEGIFELPPDAGQIDEHGTDAD